MNRAKGIATTTTALWSWMSTADGPGHCRDTLLCLVWQGCAGICYSRPSLATFTLSASPVSVGVHPSSYTAWAPAKGKGWVSGVDKKPHVCVLFPEPGSTGKWSQGKALGKSSSTRVCTYFSPKVREEGTWRWLDQTWWLSGSWGRRDRAVHGNKYNKPCFVRRLVILFTTKLYRNY